MKDIAIYGAGGQGKEVACLIRQINEQEPTWNLIGFFDDDSLFKEKHISHFGHHLGGIEELNAWDGNLGIVLAISDCAAVKKIYDRITNTNIWFPNLLHPNCYFSDKDSFNLGEGNIIHGGFSASYDVHIGDFNVFNDFTIIGHGVEIGSFNTFKPTSRISGNVKIGQGNLFGVGSIVIEKIKIGNNVRLGAGSVLMTKPKDGKLHLGVPAKPMDF